MSKNIMEEYNELLGNEFEFGSGSFGRTKELFNELDGEDFVTSKELVKMHKEGDLTDDELSNITGGPVEIEEEVHCRRFRTQRAHKYNEKELAEIREGCKRTYVHDFSENDRYHISDEERMKNDSLAEMSVKLGGLKRIYRKVDQYIYAMRIVAEAWDMVEKKENFIHTKDEFYQMVSDGRIYHSSIITPKLKGVDKYNMDLIIRYISNPQLDPSDLLTEEEIKKRDPLGYSWDDEEDDEETEEEEMKRLLSPEEVQFVCDNMDNPPTITVDDVKDKYIKGYDTKTFGKKNKKLSKSERLFTESLHDILKKVQSNPDNRTESYDYPRSWLVTKSMFEPVKEDKNFWDDKYFRGSLIDKNDIMLYNAKVNEEEMNEPLEGVAYMTKGDKNIQDMFRGMEDNGMSVTELRRRYNMNDEASRAKEEKISRKENKKHEASLIERINKLNNLPKFKKLILKAEKSVNEDIQDLY